MAKWLNRRKLAVRPDNIFLTHGGQHALAACFHALTKPGDTVLCEEWSYSGIRRLANLCHVRVASVKMDEEGVDPSSLRDQLKMTRSSVLFCTATVQNPTTATMSMSRRREILALCKKANAIVVEDDIYGIISGESLPPLAAIEPSRTIHISSVSKCLSPGVRLGALIGPESVLPGLQNALTALHWTGPSLWAELFGFMIENGSAERCLMAHRREAHRRLSLYNEVVHEAPSTTLPSYHVWQRIPSGWKPAEFTAALLNKGVRVSPAQHFSSSPEHDSGKFIRICLGGVENPGSLRTQFLVLKELMQTKPQHSSNIT